MSDTKALPCTIFDHVVWYIKTADGACRRGSIALGECLLLFTSLDSLHAFIDACTECDAEPLEAAVFSRSRKEFGRRARQAVTTGVVGALIDPAPGDGKAPFLRFAKTTH